MAAELEEERRRDDMADPSCDHSVDRVGDAGLVEVHKADHHGGVAPARAYPPRDAVDRLVRVRRWATVGHDQQAGAMAGVERPPIVSVAERALEMMALDRWVCRAVVDL